MSFICLLLSGAALLLNGLGLLGRLPARDTGYFNLLIGGTQLVLAVAASATARGDAATLLGASGVFLFGLTYLYVGIDALRGLGAAGLGWFCGLVAVLGLAYAGTAVRADPLLAVLWLTWAVLWSLFFLLLALRVSRLTRFTGWALILTSQVTTTVPGLLGLTGLWPTGSGVALVALVVVLALLAAAALLARRPAVAARAVLA